MLKEGFKFLIQGLKVDENKESQIFFSNRDKVKNIKDFDFLLMTVLIVNKVIFLIFKV